MSRIIGESLYSCREFGWVFAGPASQKHCTGANDAGPCSGWIPTGNSALFDHVVAIYFRSGDICLVSMVVFFGRKYSVYP